jgi:hypothetical protein
VGTELNRILLAADGSGVASPVAAELARRTGAELHVVRVWSADLPGAYALTMPSVRARWHEQKAGETISEDVERIEETGATVARLPTTRGATPRWRSARWRQSSTPTSWSSAAGTSARSAG